MSLVYMHRYFIEASSVNDITGVPVGLHLPPSKLSHLSIRDTEVMLLDVPCIIHIQWNIDKTLTGFQQLLI